MDSTKVNPSRKLPGERIAAREWNAVVDAFASIDVGSTRTIVPPANLFDSNVVLIWNQSGSTFARFSPFGLKFNLTPIFNPTDPDKVTSYQQHRGMNARSPLTIDTAHGSIGITLDEIPAEGYGRGIISGAVPCKIDILNTLHKYATVKNNNATELVSCTQGPCRILWREDGTGTRWAIIRLGHSMPVFFPVKIIPTATGTYGSDSTACTKTYDVTDANGQSLGTSMTPQKLRPSPGQIKIIPTDSIGLGYYDIAGTFFLWDANEVPNRYPAADT